MLIMLAIIVVILGSLIFEGILIFCIAKILVLKSNPLKNSKQRKKEFYQYFGERKNGIKPQFLLNKT